MNSYIYTDIKNNLVENLFTKKYDEIKYYPFIGFTDSKITPYRYIAHEYARICFNILEKCKLDYYVFAGSSIGHLRGKKNIPWADDYDIIIVEDNFTYFETIVINELTRYGFTVPKFIVSDLQVGYKIISPFGEKYFLCDVFYSKIENNIVKNIGNFGLYNRSNIPVDIVQPKKYLCIDDLELPFFNDIEKDVELEYGNVIDKCVIHINHWPAVFINYNYDLVYQVFNDIINETIDNTKNMYKDHEYINNFTLTSDNDFIDIENDIIDIENFLMFIFNNKIKNLYIIDSKFLKYCYDIKFYFPKITINFYMIDFITNENLIFLQDVDNIYFSNDKYIEQINNYEFLFFKNKPNFNLTNVITFGTFDLFHHGHYNILLRAKNHGVKLTVGISSDNLNISKGKTSINDIDKRILDVENTGFANVVFIEESLELKNQYIIDYDCNLLIMGDDWKDKFNFCNCACIYLPRTPFISTSILKEQLKK